MRSFLLAGALAASLVLPALARDYTLGDLRIIQPWTRATAAAGGVGGGYVVIRNTGSQPDRLIRAESQSARVLELHTMRMEQGVMRMRPVETIPIPAGGEVKLEPGGLHVMFIGTQFRFEQGRNVPARLVFERAGSIDVEFAVEAAGARQPGHAH